LRIEETIYLSRLKIINPQITPKVTANAIESKTVKKAYPDDKLASSPVKKTTPPIPTCLDTSEGDLRSNEKLEPAQ
jgi:hypothetical protein